MTKPDQVRAIVAKAPVSISTKNTKQVVRTAFREVYGVEWFNSDQTKGVFNRVKAEYAARNE